ncbi:MAG: cell wall-binding repeat-containing protein [Desulfosporosinus sp.]|nr:cell wall-binding repeat-containing protein [Desulfosporosinus sp.]
MKKNTTKKTLATLALACMTMTITPFNALANNGVTTARIFGTDRFGTAVSVADTGWTAANTAILAPAADAILVCALEAIPLAGKTSPILLTDNNTLTTATRSELIKLGVKNVYVVGPINQTIIDQVNAISGVTATVLNGTDRTDTAAVIASKLTNPAGSFVVGYDALPDALSVASYAAANNYSILLANPDGTLPASETAYKGAYTYIIGGPTLVDDIPGATRIFGADRFATNQAVLNTLTYKYDHVYVANGTDSHLVDTLVAAPLAAQSGAPIVLTDPAGDGANASANINSKLSLMAVITALGGYTVVMDSNVAQVSNGPTSSVNPGSTSVAVTGLTLNHPTLSLMAGGTSSILTATVAPNNATDQVVSWSSSNPSVATVVGGIVTPIAAGTATITATTHDGGKMATSVVSVLANRAAVAVTGLTLNHPTLALTTGNTNGTLVATVIPSNATNQVVTWSTSNTAVATVVNGVVTPVGVGTTIITATTQDGGKMATSVVSVSAATITSGGHSGGHSSTIAVTGLTLNQPTLALKIGEATGTLVATVAPSNATDQVVTWSTSNTAVATVVNGIVTPVGAGTATITATTHDGAKVATSIVTVSAVTPTDVITETTAIGTYGSLVTINLTSPVNYVGATQFQVYVNGEVSSIVAALGTVTTVYPTQALGNVVQVEFFNAAGTQVGATQNVTLK